MPVKNIDFKLKGSEEKEKKKSVEGESNENQEISVPYKLKTFK